MIIKTNLKLNRPYIKGDSIWSNMALNAGPEFKYLGDVEGEHVFKVIEGRPLFNNHKLEDILYSTRAFYEHNYIVVEQIDYIKKWKNINIYKNFDNNIKICKLKI
jgi:hypothetical protein